MATSAFILDSYFQEAQHNRHKLVTCFSVGKILVVYLLLLRFLLLLLLLFAVLLLFKISFFPPFKVEILQRMKSPGRGPPMISPFKSGVNAALLLGDEFASQRNGSSGETKVKPKSEMNQEKRKRNDK